MADDKDLRNLNLWQKIAHVQATLAPILKDKKTETGPKYNYVSAERVFSILQKKLGEIGVVILPEINGVDPKPGNADVNTYRLHFTLVNADNPEEQHVSIWMAEARNNSDKGANGASTIGLKYFLLRLLLSSDEKDPEQVEQEEIRARAVAWYQRVQKAQATLEGRTPTPAQVDRLRTLLEDGRDLTPDRPVSDTGGADPLGECLAIAEYLRITR